MRLQHGPEPHDEPQDILDSPHATQAVVRGGVWRISSYLAANALAVLSAAVVVRYLGVQNLARYTIVVSLMTVITGVFEAGLTNLGVRESTVRERADRQQFLRDLLGLRLTVAVAGVGVGVVVATAAGYPGVMVTGTVVAGLGVVAYTLQSHYATALQTELRLGWYSALEFVRQLGFTSFAVLVAGLDLGLLALLAVPVPAQLIVLVVTVGLVGSVVPRGVSFSAARWRALLGQSVPVVAATAVSVVYSYVAILIMSVVSTEHQTGLFSAGFRIVTVLLAIPGLVVSAVLPVLARAARDDRARLEIGMQRTFEVSLVLGAGLALLTVIGAPIAIAVVAGPAFQDSVSVLQILGAALLPTSVVAFGGFGLISLGAYKQILVCSVIGLIVTVGLTIGLSSPLGADGAAIANLAGECTIAVLYIIALARNGVATNYRPAALSVLAAIPGIVLAVIMPWPAIVEVLCAAVLFGGSAIALGIVPPELRAALPMRRLRG